MPHASESDSLATRATLLSRVRDLGNDAGWQELFDKYRALIRGLALRSGLNDSEADDVLQETMTSLTRQLPDFRYDPARGSFKGWLSTIVRRRIIDQLRKRRPTEPLHDGHAEAQPLNEELWESEWREHVTRETLARVRAAVAPLQFQMFDLFAIQGMKMSDVRRVLGVSAPQVYMAKMRVSIVFRRERAAVERALEKAE